MEEKSNLDRLHEISERLTDTEFQLSQANALIAAIFNGADEAIIAKDFDGIITAWNLAAEQLYGWKREEAVGQHISLIVPRDKMEEQQEISANIREGQSTKLVTERIRKDGKKVPIRLTISPVTASNGKIVGASDIAHPPNWVWDNLDEQLK